MGMLVLLVEDAEATISATTSQHLARLGVSRVELLRDAHTTAIVLEGWAFDPGSADAITQAVTPGLVARILRPVMRIVVGDPDDHLIATTNTARADPERSRERK
jgi:hypothetical protein